MPDTLDGGSSHAPATATDAQLIARVARVDPLSFSELYDRHSRVAHGLAQRIVGPAHADDVVQDAFLALWRNAAQHDPALGGVRPWLLGMVRHRSIDVLRKRARHERHRTESEGFEERLTAAGSTEELVEGNDRTSSVRAALRALPEPQRAVVELAYFAGLTQQEISERLKLPLGTVKGRTRLAFDKLRTELDACAPG